MFSVNNKHPMPYEDHRVYLFLLPVLLHVFNDYKLWYLTDEAIIWNAGKKARMTHQATILSRWTRRRFALKYVQQFKDIFFLMWRNLKLLWIKQLSQFLYLLISYMNGFVYPQSYILNSENRTLSSYNNLNCQEKDFS